MSLPTHDSDWRLRWERLTEILEQSLDEPEPDSDRICELVRQRQRLLMASSPIANSVGGDDSEAQAAWLACMIKREKRLQDRAEHVQGYLKTCIQSLVAASNIRKKLPKEYGRPSYLDQQV